ncbi:hypothetical protein CTM97_18495 [Photobacterium phosphoreum]|uniref:Uncharacterized protein n=1 Tax=Photobacterium phosphoreum TaxID=659 RepID=A0A2T3JBT6_PHOPO|nr:hypothetical protein CTM96_20475 [Photobacterium phosphoreum]PSU38778.1 hypothetical protein CTM97_18495 [Photobacterium phosphoreum]PSU46299.1 hypothetical protein C9J18_20755 [Photobacterium phosphoreum]
MSYEINKLIIDKLKFIFFSKFVRLFFLIIIIQNFSHWSYDYFNFNSIKEEGWGLILIVFYILIKYSLIYLYKKVKS